MSVIPCEQNQQLRKEIRDYAEVLKSEAHKLSEHGLSKEEFYNSGLFRGARERIRGQFSASMQEKRKFVYHILDHLKNQGYIAEWQSVGESNRHDYSIKLNSGRTAVIELKGCLDGNNTNIFERPPHADEFIIWSVCTNPGADPRHNAWSGIDTRLGAEMIFRQERVDGLIIWDMVCGTLGRPCCPKIKRQPTQISQIGPHQLPPPCIYLFPSTIPSPRNNPHPKAQNINDVEIMRAFHTCFKGQNRDLFFVSYKVNYRDSDTVRTTTIYQDGKIQRESEPTAIRRA